MAAAIDIAKRAPTVYFSAAEIMPATPKQAFVALVARLQGGLCAICGKPMRRDAKFGSRWGRSLDHVWPRCKEQTRRGIERPSLHGRKNGTYGNAVAAHGWCNSCKGHREPTGCELIWLAAVNARLGRDAPQKSRFKNIACGLCGRWYATHDALAAHRKDSHPLSLVAT